MMKFLLVTVSVIAVFTAECQALRNEPREDRLIPDGGKRQVEIEGGQNWPDGRDISLPATQLGENQTSSEDQPLYGESEGPGEAEDLENLPARRGILIPATQLVENQTSSEGSNPDLKDHQMKVGDKFEFQKAQPICGSALGGRCRPSNVDCRRGEEESQYGKPYCQINRRCCYPELPHPTTQPTSNPPITTPSVTPSCQDLQKAVSHLCVSTQCPTSQPPTTTPSGGCPTGFEECPYGNCYYFSSSVRDTDVWREARNKCKVLIPSSNYVIDLAELENTNDGRCDEWLMQRIAAKGQFAWLGAHFTDGQWTWAHSGRQLPLSFPFWAPTQPSANMLCTGASLVGDKGRHYLNSNHCGIGTNYVCQIFD